MAAARYPLSTGDPLLTDTARQRLMKRFKLSERQAVAILDMQLRRLAALERQKIEDEHKEIKKLALNLTENAARERAPSRDRSQGSAVGPFPQRALPLRTEARP